jgi:hypothetical protein
MTQEEQSTKLIVALDIIIVIVITALIMWMAYYTRNM